MGVVSFVDFVFFALKRDFFCSLGLPASLSQMRERPGFPGTALLGTSRRPKKEKRVLI